MPTLTVGYATGSLWPKGVQCYRPEFHAPICSILPHNIVNVKRFWKQKRYKKRYNEMYHSGCVTLDGEPSRACGRFKGRLARWRRHKLERDATVDAGKSGLRTFSSRWLRSYACPRPAAGQLIASGTVRKFSCASLLLPRNHDLERVAPPVGSSDPLNDADSLQHHEEKGAIAGMASASGVEYLRFVGPQHCRI